MKQRRLYTIGDFVLVFKTMMRDKQESKVTWRKALEYVSTKLRLGQVVGLTTKYDGVVEYEPDLPCHYFVPSKSHHLWLVRFGLTNKPVYVAEGDMRFAVGDEITELPYSYPSQEMSERDKQYLREDSKHWPRDAKGRWVKGPVVHG
jgi:hypothetical protein